MPRPLSEQVVVIIGASSGMGRETALEFGRAGAKVVLAARNHVALSEVANAVQAAGGQAHVVTTDAADFGQVEKLAAEAVSMFGRVDTWINDASVALYATVEDSTVEEIERVMQVNFMGVVHGCKAILPYMRQQGYGTIINFGSVVSWMPLPLLSAYSASKHAVKGFTDALRLEMERERTGVHLTLVMPAGINTPFFNHARSKLGVKPQPTPPVYQPEVVAKAVVHAAEHPQRDIYGGGAAWFFAMMERFSPALVDRFLMAGNFVFKAQKSDQPDDNVDNLFAPVIGPGRSHGDYDKMTKPSLFTWLFEIRPGWLMLPGLLAGVMAFVGLRRKTA